MNGTAVLLFLQFPSFAHLHMLLCVLFSFILGFRILVRILQPMDGNSSEM